MSWSGQFVKRPKEEWAMEQYDVTALGELLIDFTENGTSCQGNPLLEANPGGAPCNVLAMLNKLGKKTAFIGKIGDDMFGSQLAFVHTKDDGDREFSFYRKPGADMMLAEEDLEEELLKNCKIFHFGTLSMTHEACRKATQKAIAIAKESGALIV